MNSNTVSVKSQNGILYIQFPKLEKCTGIRHIFSTRVGGVSTGDCASMNLSFNKDTCRENVLENYRRLCGCVGIDPAHLVLSHQTHTDHVISVGVKHRGTGITLPSFGDVDGMITNCPGVALVTQFADCTPLLFYDPVKKVIANTHSGWRGTVKQIGKVTVEKMQKDFGCDPGNIIAAVGPCIGRCCYEVDEPVFNAFSALRYIPTETIFTAKGNGKYMLDLPEANRRILLESGIRPEHMDISDICTCCHADKMHSHRATGGKRGNLAAVIELI